jgi:hypothetical protein
MLAEHKRREEHEKSLQSRSGIGFACGSDLNVFRFLNPEIDFGMSRERARRMTSKSRALEEKIKTSKKGFNCDRSDN